jgi:CheY-like chemotaxis protein
MAIMLFISQSKLRKLLSDQSPFVQHDDARRYLGLFLKQTGVNVVVARNAFEGFEAIKYNLPNLVVSDIRMAGMGVSARNGQYSVNGILSVSR